MIKRMMQTLVATLALVLLFSPAGQARSLDDIVKSGVIRIGVNPNFPPMSAYGETNEFEGFDIEVGNIIAERLGVEAEYVPTETPQRVPFIVSERIDISLGALTRTTSRSMLIDYTVPLHTEVMAVLTTDKVMAEMVDDLNSSDITLVNIRATWPVDYNKERLPNANMILVDSIADTVRAVAQGRGDAIVENIDFFMAHTRNHPDVNWRVLPEKLFVAYCGIGVQKNNHSLRQFLNILLYELHSGGKINELWEAAYGAPMLVEVEPTPFF